MQWGCFAMRSTVGQTVTLGQATYRQSTQDRGYGGAYGNDRRPARWECVDCGRSVDGTDLRPWLSPNGHTGKYGNACCDNGHGPCSYCGKVLPRLADGSLRAHPWRICPGKTEAHRVIPRPGDMADATTPRRCA